MQIFRCYMISTLLFINGCAGTKPVINTSPNNTSAHQYHLASLNNIKSFALKGRLGVVTQQKGFTGSIQWQHLSDVDDISIYSPLGAKIANIAKNGTGVTLTSQDGKRFQAQDAESLTENTLGFRLPLSNLSNWVIGKTGTNNIEALSIDEMGRIITFKQDGWHISYENYTEIDRVALPTKILLKSEKVNLKIIIEKWISQ